MSYFSEHYDEFRLPIEAGERPGFRMPQVGALHALGAHFSRDSEPAIITMPTGSGKTAVLIGTSFLLRAERALVLTPSRLVREQIVTGFRSLEVLKRVAAVGLDTQVPSVVSVEKRITSSADWEELRNYDVVVGTPHSLSPSFAEIPEFPPDLFDLVLVDEAHHSAARTWRELLRYASEANQVLYTATPFRQDQKEIVGKFVYEYELREALRDGVFGELEYKAVLPQSGQVPDVAIAKSAAAALRQDQQSGLDHLIMVRTGSKNKAKELEQLYARETDLQLRAVTGSHSLRHLRNVVGKLQEGELDGVICVDMLGEGFDLPRLKIAALHSPHRSLAVTLQFIGRFARVTAPNLGRAAFFALESDMEIEREKLFNQGAAWQEIIPNLSAARVREETRTREMLQTFSAEPTLDSEAPDLSLYSLKPYNHVKILNAGPEVDIAKEITFPSGLFIEHRHVSEEQATAIFVTREVSQPDWTTADHFIGAAFDLFVIYHHSESGLLFICSSNRTASIYEHLAKQYAAEGAPAPGNLSLRRLNKVLIGLEESRFFNIGMRNSVASNRSESYRTLTGPDVEEVIERSDGRLFRRGHWYGSAVENGERVTLGLSSSSKVWSNTSSRIPQLIEWCKGLAAKIMSEGTPQTFGGLDNLDVGEDAEAIPPNVVFVNWHRKMYETPLRIQYRVENGPLIRTQLLDLELSVEHERTDQDQIGLLISGENLDYRMAFRLDGYDCMSSVTDNDTEIYCESPYEDRLLTEMLKAYPPTFYTADFAELAEASTYYPPPQIQVPFDSERIEAIDWEAVGVDIENEVQEPTEVGVSIHAHFESRLLDSDTDVVFYDHGSGEIADFVTVSSTQNETRVALYHCKGSGGKKPGDRVADAYEICGQAVKSTSWAERRRIRGEILRRWSRQNGGSHFLKGDADVVRSFLGDPFTKRFIFQIVLVQPGFERSNLSTKIGSLLAATDDFVFGGRCARLRVIAST